MTYIYLLLNLFTIAYPAYAFRDERVNYYKKWKPLLYSIFLTGCLFVTWDHFFTKWNVWSFNPNYLIGIEILSLPIEEWLFFVTVPFACIFIYEVIHYFFPEINSRYNMLVPGYFLGVLLIAFAAINQTKTYTWVVFAFSGTLVLIHLIAFGGRFLNGFFLTYLIHLVPFFAVNGVLTYLPVVMYNNEENLQIRIGSIPIEDAVYSFSMLLMLVSLYEVFKTKFLYKGKSIKA